MKPVETNTKIYAALVKARSEFKPVLFDKVNPHFRNRFASLAAINDAVVDALAKYGLMTMQPWKHLENGDVILETVLIHESGESIRSSCLVKAGKTDQQFGASCTYMRRYQLSSLLNVVGEEDDDGESGQGRISPPTDLKNKHPQKKGCEPSDDNPLSEEQYDKLEVLSMELNDNEYLKKLSEYLQVPSIFEIKAKDYEKTMKSIDKRIKANESSRVA